MDDLKHVCIIDDDSTFVFGAKKMMQIKKVCNDFTVYQNGQQAIEGLSKKIENSEKMPDLVLLDINMPVLDGWQFLDAFIERYPASNLKFVLVSSSIDPRDKETAKTYNCISHFITKPITLETIDDLFPSYDLSS